MAERPRDHGTAAPSGAAVRRVKDPSHDRSRLPAVSELIEDAPLAEAEQDAATWRILLRSFWTLVAGGGAARDFGLVTMLLLARDLGPDGFGLTAVGIALVYRFAVVS